MKLKISAAVGFYKTRMRKWTHISPVISKVCYLQPAPIPNLEERCFSFSQPTFIKYLMQILCFDAHYHPRLSHWTGEA